MEAVLAGRKRKDGKRHKSGKLVQPRADEREDDVKKVARTSRLKDALKAVDNPHFGSVLGRAHLLGLIDEKQREAGFLLEHTVRVYASTMGIVLTPKGAVTLEKNPGASLNAPPDEKTIAKIRKDYDDAFAAMLSAGRREAKEVVRVCIWADQVSDAYALRAGLTPLVELWAIQPDAPEKSKAAVRIKGYAVADYRPGDRPELRKAAS